MRDVLEAHARWLRAEKDGTRADLRGAVLRDAVLTGAVLRGAVLRGADLTRADLTRADLRGAVLRGADLRGAVLTRAVLTDAVLRDAVLTDADLRGADKARLSILPAGDLIGWKSCAFGVVVKLRIPAEARRSNATGRKCRAEFADVLEVIGAAEGRTDRTALGGSVVIYRTGERVIPDSWDDNWALECGHGIHFFITEEEARAWQ
jgi:hypothetical protein